MINQEELLRDIEKSKRMGWEFEVIIRDRGESREESILKLLSNKIIREQIIEIGNIGRREI